MLSATLAVPVLTALTHSGSEDLFPVPTQPASRLPSRARWRGPSRRRRADQRREQLRRRLLVSLGLAGAARRQHGVEAESMVEGLSRIFGWPEKVGLASVVSKRCAATCSRVLVVLASTPDSHRCRATKVAGAWPCAWRRAHGSAAIERRDRSGGLRLPARPRHRVAR